MSEPDPFFCGDCGRELTHDDIATVEAVPQLDVESYALEERTAEVYQCRHCGVVIGFDLE